MYPLEVNTSLYSLTLYSPKPQRCVAQWKLFTNDNEANVQKN